MLLDSFVENNQLLRLHSTLLSLVCRLCLDQRDCIEYCWCFCLYFTSLQFHFKFAETQPLLSSIEYKCSVASSSLLSSFRTLLLNPTSLKSSSPLKADYNRKAITTTSMTQQPAFRITPLY